MSLSWETIIEETRGEKTERLNVPGGWLVRSLSGFYLPQSMAMEFVADETHDWTIE